VRVDGLWHEDETRLIASSCDPLVEEVRLQLFPLKECEFPIVQEGGRVTFRKACRPARDYEAEVDASGVVTGTTAIRSAQQGCVINLEVRFSYAMATSPTSGGYTLLWNFSSSCRPLLSCEQALRTVLTRREAAASPRGIVVPGHAILGTLQARSALRYIVTTHAPPRPRLCWRASSAPST
jgi:hypothetical protein